MRRPARARTLAAGLAVLALLGGCRSAGPSPATVSYRVDTVSHRTAVEVLPRLEVRGNRIVDTEHGQDVILRGANVLRSEWDLQMNAERRAIPALADWGANVVVRGFASDPVNAGDDGYLDMLDEHVALAAANGLYVVFAWRSHTVNGPQPRMPDDRAQVALARLASRYGHHEHVMYALQVEPHDVTWQEVQPRFVEMVDAVRAAAAPGRPLIFVPGVQWGRDVSGAVALPVQRPGIVYKTHPYNQADKFHEQFVRTYEAGLPVFIGEFGLLPEHGMSMSDVSALLAVAAELQLGWAAWAFDYQGNPELVTDNRTFRPTHPYGTAVKKAMGEGAPA